MVHCIIQGLTNCVLVVATFAFENVATLALSVNLTTYFNGVMHFELADAANELTNYLGTSYILSILAAVLADSYIGRYKAVLIGGFLELVVCLQTLHTIFDIYKLLDILKAQLVRGKKSK